MNNRYETENVLKGGLHITTDGGVNATLNIDIEDTISVYASPPIPPGYNYLHGDKYKGWTCKRLNDDSLITWIPVEALTPNGTLNGTCFTEKFGRRYMPTRLSTQNSKSRA